MVFQNPDNQIVATMVEEDVAFGPENIQVPTAEIWKRVERALGSVNMTRFRHKSPLKLSGGQKQRVAIAGIIAMEPWQCGRNVLFWMSLRQCLILLEEMR